MPRFAVAHISQYPQAPPAAQPLHPRRQREFASPRPTPPPPSQPSTSSQPSSEPEPEPEPLPPRGVPANRGARGAGRGRGAGGQRGRGRARVGLGAARPVLGAGFAVAHISQYPQAPPAAQPLHPRRKRQFSSPRPTPPPPSQPSSSSQPSSEPEPEPPPSQPSTSSQPSSEPEPEPLPLREAEVSVVVEAVEYGFEDFSLPMMSPPLPLPQLPMSREPEPLPPREAEVTMEVEAVESAQPSQSAQPPQSKRRRRFLPPPPPPSPRVFSPAAAVPSPSAFEDVSAGTSAAPSPAASSPAPSPAASSPRSHPPRPAQPRRLLPPKALTDAEISLIINAGSEEESDLSDDADDFEALAAKMPSRVDRDFEREARRCYFSSSDEEEVVESTDVPEVPGDESPWPLPLRDDSPLPLREESPLRELVGEIGPVDMFSFDWVPMGPNYVANPGRKEEFRPPRPVGSVRHFADPYDAFTAIWNREIMELICTRTNEYAEEHAEEMMRTGVMKPSSRISKWKPTSIDELYLLFAIDISMGIVMKGAQEEYWNTSQDIFETPGFKVVMSRNRYVLLKRCLHLSSRLTGLEENLTQSQVKLHKIRPILDHLNERFRSLYVPDEDIALDESLTEWKGLLGMVQYIRNKAASIGIKSYEVCESNTGYLHRFEVHAGHDNQSDDASPVTGVIPSLVLRLLSDLEDRGHTVWMDNFYNSPALARSLKSRGFDCVGTLRTDRQFVPTELKDLKKVNIIKGGVVGATSGDVDIMVWRDKNRVALISTYHGNVVSMCHTGDFKPNVVLDYNLRMGGVDKKDQMLAAFPMERKRTKIWYKKFFRRLVNVSILNSFVLYKSSTPSLRTNHRDFRKQLCRQLLERHCISRPRQPNVSRLVPPSYPSSHIPVSYLVWEKLKTDSKLYYQSTRRSTTATGGGPSDIKIDPILEQVCALLGRACTGIEGVQDCDADTIEIVPKKVCFDEGVLSDMPIVIESIEEIESDKENKNIQPTTSEETNNISKTPLWSRRRPQLCQTNERTEAVSTLCSSFTNVNKKKEIGEDIKLQILEEELKWKKKQNEFQLEEIMYKRKLYEYQLEAAAKDVEIKTLMINQMKGGGAFPR